jgi:pimeloyl-ACP methyl ester carboxylesterase
MTSGFKWIIPITGFRENPRHESGLERIWKNLRPLASASTVVVTPYEWNEDLGGLVNFILRNSPAGPTEVMVIAYSWGCGVGFVKFAREAACVGLRITVAVLCDPVYRSRLFPTWLPFNPLSVSRFLRPTITVPPSVERVEWVRQNLDIPQGHNLVAEDPARTKVGLGRYVRSGHTRIDDSPEFRCLVDYWAKVFVYDLDPKEIGVPKCQGEVNAPPALTFEERANWGND